MWSSSVSFYEQIKTQVKLDGLIWLLVNCTTSGTSTEPPLILYKTKGIKAELGNKAEM